MSSDSRIGAFPSAITALAEVERACVVSRFERCGDADSSVTSLLQQVARNCCVRFHVGRVSPDWRGWPRFFAALSRLRESRQCELWLACEVSDDIDAATVNGMALAGVRFARIVGQSSPTLARIRTVKLLSAAGIQVEWELPNEIAQVGSRIASLIGGWLHLPPPSSSNRPCFWPSAIESAVETWHRAHRPRSLTYSRGPGFVKILDRRVNARAWTFIVLEGGSAEVFLRTVEGSSFDALVASVKLRPSLACSLLDRLVSQRIVATLEDAWFLALPIRRAVEERWVSGVY